jgi:hypothetical protein
MNGGINGDPDSPWNVEIGRIVKIVLVYFIENIFWEGTQFTDRKGLYFAVNNFTILMVRGKGQQFNDVAYKSKSVPGCKKPRKIFPKTNTNTA